MQSTSQPQSTLHIPLVRVAVVVFVVVAVAASPRGAANAPAARCI